MSKSIVRPTRARHPTSFSTILLVGLGLAAANCSSSDSPQTQNPDAQITSPSTPTNPATGFADAGDTREQEASPDSSSDGESVEEASVEGGVAEHDAGLALAIPCTVDTILKASCQGCHASPPKRGAPFALVTYADITAESNGEPIYKTMLSEVEIRAMPPRSVPFSDADRTTLMNWLAQGAPTASAEQTCP